MNASPKADNGVADLGKRDTAGDHGLYRQIILEHAREPRNFAPMEAASRRVEGINPLCGDKLTLYLSIEGGRIAQASFEGTGCAISLASASLLTDAVAELPLADALRLKEALISLLEQGEAGALSANPRHAPLTALAGVRGFPSRIKCATLAWQALERALSGTQATVSRTVTTE
ncbi:MAG: Fe-S cluster assembly sulfur transfer protein SufU [Pseudomonadota bacterium]